MSVKDYCAKKMCGGFPVLTQEQLDAANDLFPAYVFVSNQKDGPHLYTSCCRKRDYALSEQRTVDGRAYLCASLPHNVKTTCPFCGKEATVKWLSKAGKRKSLRAYRPVVFLNAEEDTPLYAQAYVAYKDYDDILGLTAYPTYRFEAAYRFEPGNPLMLEQNYWSKKFDATKGERLREPFRVGLPGMLSYPPYQLIGEDAIERSCMKYSQYEAFHQKIHDMDGFHGSMMRYLSAYCLHPQIEMLAKMGIWDVVKDLVWRDVKNAASIDWKQDDPRKALGLTKPELKYWLGQEHKNILDVGLYKRLKRHGHRVDFQWLCGLSLTDTEKTWLVRQVVNRKLKIKRVVNYLDKFTGPRCYGGWFGLNQAVEYWKDYLMMGEQLHYDFTDEVVLFPKSLFQAHDTANEILQERARELRRRELQEQGEREMLAQEGYTKLLERLDDRYSFQMAGCHIRPPVSMQEIIAEGQALKHCVGGYAVRHVEGKATILFLRDDQNPKQPLVTIEMNGSKLVQIHGYKNEIDGAENPRTRFAAIVEPWLAWVKAGSKRDKDGNPILPKQKEDKSA